MNSSASVSLQSSKVLAKHELLKVPLIGWTWYFLEIVFCKRKWEEDRKTVFSGLDRLKDYPEHMWVSANPNATEGYSDSFKIGSPYFTKSGVLSSYPLSKREQFSLFMGTSVRYAED